MSAPRRKSETAGYAAVFVALLALTAATVAAARVDLGGLNNLAALTIAGAKAALVAAYFMHLRRASGLVKAAAAAGCVWFGILLALTFSDFLTRGW